MDDTELFAKPLRIAPPWRETRLSVDMAAERVDLGVEETPGTKSPCAVCRAPAPVYDQGPTTLPITATILVTLLYLAT